MITEHHAKFATGNFYHVYNRANTNTGKLFYQEKNYAFFLRKFDQYLSDYLEVWAYCLINNHFHFLVKVKDIDTSTSSDSIKAIHYEIKEIDIVALNETIDTIKKINVLVSSDSINVVNAIKKIDTLTLIKNINTIKNIDITGLVNSINAVKNIDTILAPINAIIEEQFRKFFLSYAKAINKQESRRGNVFQKGFKRIHIAHDTYLMAIIHYIHHNPIHHGLTQEFQNWHYSSYNAFIGLANTKLMRAEVLELFGNRNKFIEFHQMLADYNKIKSYVIEE